jgi:hypothetical protein
MQGMHWFANQHGKYICRLEKLCCAMSLICELGIIVSTFIFLRNEIAWQKWIKDAGHSGGSRERMVMLIFSIASTACIIFFTIVGRGNMMSGLKMTWKGVTKVSKIATSVGSLMLPHFKTFKTSIHPTDRDDDPEQEDEASSEGLHGL